MLKYLFILSLPCLLWCSETIKIGTNEVRAEFVRYYDNSNIPKEIALAEVSIIDVGEAAIPFYGLYEKDTGNENLSYKEQKKRFNEAKKNRFVRVFFFYDEKKVAVKSGYLADDVKILINGVWTEFSPKHHPAQSDISFYSNSMVKNGMLGSVVSYNIASNNIAFRPQSNIECADIYYYQSGNIQAGYPYTNFVFTQNSNTLYISSQKESAYGAIQFSEKGTLLKCFLYSNSTVTINEKIIEIMPNAGVFGDVFFDEEGNLSKASPTKNIMFNLSSNEIVFAKSNWLRLKNKTPISGTLAEDVTLYFEDGNEATLQKNYEAEFYEDGSLKWGRLAKDFIYYKKTAPISAKKNAIEAGNWIYRYTNETDTKYYTINTLQECLSDIPYRIGEKEILLPKGTKLGFRNDTKIFWKIIFHEDTTIDGVLFRRNEETTPEIIKEKISGR